MASVDDNEELIATRRLNGLDDGLYESDKNVANKIKRQVENTINYYKNIDNIEEIPIDILRAMYQDILEERKQDKKRIKELEEENKIFVQNGSNVKLEIYIKNNYIPKQKVKDKIKDLEYNSDLGFEKSLEEIFKIEVLEELLEEK